MLREWEIGLLERLERFIERERITNSEVIKNLRGIAEINAEPPTTPPHQPEGESPQSER